LFLSATVLSERFSPVYKDCPATHMHIHLMCHRRGGRINNPQMPKARRRDKYPWNSIPQPREER